MDYPVSNDSPELLTKSELNQSASTNRRANEEKNGDHVSNTGPSPFANPQKPTLRLLSDFDLNNNDIPAIPSDALPKIQEAPKSRTPRKPKDQRQGPPKRKPKKNDDFDGLHEDGVGYPRGFLKLCPESKYDKLMYDALNGKLRDVGVKTAEKKSKNLEDHLFKK